jgi:HK97 family phage major capsid protein
MAPLTTPLAELLAAEAAEQASWPREPITAFRRLTGDPRNETMTLDELEARQQAIRSRVQELDNEFRGQAFPENPRAEYNELNEEHDANDRLITELRARQERVRELHRDGDDTNRERGADFNVPSPRRGEDVWDYSHIRGASSLEGQQQLLRDQAKRAVERSNFYQPRTGAFRREDRRRTVDNDEARGHVEWLLDTVDNNPDTPGWLARRILNTGNPVYMRAFGKVLASAPLSPEEQRALSLTNTAGGYAVPFTLDPTVLLTANIAVNPYRRIARVVQITTTTWQGLTSGGTTVSRVSEGTEAGDNSPTLGQPSVTPQRVQGFIPFSIEIGQDWTGLQAEMAREIAEAKDVEEATSFTTGTGTPPAAQGVITGATTTVTAGGTAAFAGADLYKVEEALPDRFLPNAQWLGTRFAYNKVRQFDTAGGASIWTKSLTEGIGTDAAGNTGYELLGYPANRVSTMTAALTTGSKILVLGDFSRFAIVDRIGMDIELIPHLFGAANRRPTGQRGIYAIWRNDSRVLDANAFRVLVTG